MPPLDRLRACADVAALSFPISGGEHSRGTMEAWHGPLLQQGAFVAWRAESDSGGAVHTPPIHRKKRGLKRRASPLKCRPLYLPKGPCVAYTFVNTGASFLKHRYAAVYYHEEHGGFSVVLEGRVKKRRGLSRMDLHRAIICLCRLNENPCLT